MTSPDATEEDRMDAREPWWVHHPDHMKGWEAFGVSGHAGEEPTVRRLGVVTFDRGMATTEIRPGTDPWGPGEVRLGVAGIHIGASADAPGLAYIHVIGTEREDVEARWHVADAVFQQIKGTLWPKRRSAP